MIISIFLSYLPYALVTTYTLGPNNILSLYTVSNKGWKKGKYTIAGVCAGFFCVTVLCGLLCYELSKYIPSLTYILKYVGAAYIFYLAIHVAFSKYEEKEGSSSSFLQGFLLQFVNVKIIMYAITVYTGYILTTSRGLGVVLINAVGMTLIGGIGTLTWGIAGGVMKKFISKYYRIFNIAMGIILAFCAIGILRG